ncbi:MAG: 30S ribosome-binding factor RbfA [Pararhodobacter sp.]
MCAKRFSQGRGPSQRQLRVAEVIRHRLAEVLTRGDVHDPELSRMSITVSEVTTSPDLKHATAYVMPLGGRDAEAALSALRRSRSELRHLVGAGLGLKFTPDLRFELDATFDRMDDTRRIFADPRVRADVDAPDTDDDRDDDR